MLSETHFYDGKLERTKSEIQERLEHVEWLDQENIQEAFHQLQTKLDGQCSSEEWHNLERLIGEQEMYYDPVNGLRVDWLLYLCYEKIVLEDNHHFIKNFKLQLQDLSGGFCVQGRTVRLLQLLIAFE